MRPNALLSLRQRREEVIELLCDSYAADLLAEADFENRLDLVHRATDLVVLDEIVRDIETRPAADVAPLPKAVALVASHGQSTRNVVAVMAGVTRKGGWTAPRKLRVTAIMGAAEIDLREVAFPAGESEIRIYAIMGAVEVIVPPTLVVECSGAAVMGAFESLDRAPTAVDANVPRVRITGIAVMGACEVSTRLLGETARDARKRRKLESKARAKARTKLLGS